MTYVMSDIHGNYHAFKKMLEEINFSDKDLLYIAGDLVDYGEEGMELICDVSMRENVYSIVGDHDFEALKMLSKFEKMLKNGETPDPSYAKAMNDWVHDGGALTLEGFRKLDEDMREGVIEYLSDMSLYEEVEAGGKKYLLLHAGIAGFEPETPIEDYMPEDFISEPLDLKRAYFDDVTIVAGHVPTYEIDGAERGKIFRGEGSVMINCGAAFDEPLACLRLEDGKEFYV